MVSKGVFFVCLVCFGGWDQSNGHHPTRIPAPPSCDPRKPWPVARQFSAIKAWSRWHCWHWHHPSNKLTICYWKWPFMVDLPIKHGDFQVSKLFFVYQMVFSIVLNSVVPYKYNHQPISSNRALADHRGWRWSEVIAVSVITSHTRWTDSVKKKKWW